MNIDVINLDGKKVGGLALDAAVFGAPVRADLLQRAVKWQLARVRAGLAFTKTRGEIDRSKKKMYKQKGTGGARHGARSPSLFVGGGVVFGPRGRDFAHSLTKRVRALALKTALSSKLAGGKLIVIDEAKLANHKTKDFAAQLAKLNLSKVTFIVDSLEANFDRASRNIPHLKVLPTEGANVYDILRGDALVLTQNAVKMLEARLNGSAEATAEKPTIAKPTERMYTILVRPLVTEKSSKIAEQNWLAFEVAGDATRTEVRAAFSALYGAEVLKVNILNLKGKSATLKGRTGQRNPFKKAYIRLKDGTSVDVMAGVK
jgi:large subunit ribosomal protein L4